MKRLCSKCGKRPPLFQVKGGRIKADTDHDMCQQCTRAVKNSLRTTNSNRYLPEVEHDQPLHT